MSATTRDVRDGLASGDLVYDEVCRVLVGGKWLLVGVPFETMRQRFDDRGARGDTALYLGEDPSATVPLIVERRQVVAAFVCAGWGSGWAVAPIDDEDCDRLGLVPF